MHDIISLLCSGHLSKVFVTSQSAVLRSCTVFVTSWVYLGEVMSGIYDIISQLYSRGHSCKVCVTSWVYLVKVMSKYVRYHQSTMLRSCQVCVTITVGCWGHVKYVWHQRRTVLRSCSRAVRSDTCCLTSLCSPISLSNFSFILLSVCIISSFSCVLASHSRSFFSIFCWSSWWSAKIQVTMSQHSNQHKPSPFNLDKTLKTCRPFRIFSACSFHCLTSFSLTSLKMVNLLNEWI